jgi:hypothetical protein
MLRNLTADINTDGRRQPLYNGASHQTHRIDFAGRQVHPRAVNKAAPGSGQYDGMMQGFDQSRTPSSRSMRGERKRRRYRFRIPYRIARGYSNASELEKHWAYEESTTKYILRRYGLKELGRRLWRLGKEQDGFGHLLLGDFCEITQFPIWLQSRPLDTTRLTLADSLGDLRRTPMVAALVQIARNVPAWAMELPVGLVFPAPGVRCMVMHGWGQDASDKGTQLLRAGHFRSQEMVWCIEPLGALLDKIDATGRVETCSHEQIVWRRNRDE